MLWIRTITIVTRSIIFAVSLAGFGFIESVPAQNTNDITLSLDSTTAQPGDTVELTVSMMIDGDGPESLIVFMAYDPDALTPNTDEYELIQRNSVSGEPILDNDGNTVAIRRAVRPSGPVTEADKTIDSEVFADEGVIGVSVTGLNMTAIPEGALFTLAFTASAGLGNGSTTTVVGLNEDNAVVVPDGDGGVVSVSTSASRSTPDGTGAVEVTYGFVDSEVFLGCEPPDTPANVSASQNRSDGVQVGWTAVATTGAEYRVYRSTINDPSTAVALGAEWQAGTSFLDITSQVPEVVMGDGCNIPDQVNEVRYFYWVRARTPSGCQGALSAVSAEGFRLQAKREVSAAGLIPDGRAIGTLLVYGTGFLLLHLAWLCWGRARAAAA